MRTLSILVLVALAVPAYAQTSDAPPDLSGVWRRAFEYQNLLEPPPSGFAPIVQYPRYPKTNSNGVPKRNSDWQGLAGPHGRGCMHHNDALFWSRPTATYSNKSDGQSQFEKA